MQNGCQNGGDKARLRAALLQRRRAMSAADKARESAEICAQVLRSPAWQCARTLAAYMPLPDEVDVTPLIRAALQRGMTVLLPRVAGRKLVWHRVASLDAAHFAAGAFGIREPRAEQAPVCAPHDAPQPILWLVPGVGFDARGGRLGRGGGFYDRALRAAQAVTGTVGVAFACQILDAVPVTAQDWTLESVVSPAGWHTAV